jgi:DNA modification methylase
MTPRKEVLADGVELWLGDCREILPSLPRVDAVVTDPPYGKRIDRDMARKSGTQHGQARAAKRIYEATGWDDDPPSDETISLMRHAATWQVIFGGNYFDLPPSSCWLVWDKKTTGNYADCELAWTNIPTVVRRIEWTWNGMIRKGDDCREHPTQKPEGVIKWCIEQLPEPNGTIIDPMMGSGTTGVAAVKLSRKFIGIERVSAYFDIARRRISEALKQPDLFIEKPKPPTQEKLFL